MNIGDRVVVVNEVSYFRGLIGVIESVYVNAANAFNIRIDDVSNAGGKHLMGRVIGFYAANLELVMNKSVVIDDKEYKPCSMCSSYTTQGSDKPLCCGCKIP